MDRMARDSFGRHEIAKESTGRWLLKRPDEPAFLWTEIICLAGNGLLVDGDVQPVVFRYGPTEPEARIQWMGCRKTAHDPYFVEKAIIGTGGSGQQPIVYYYDSKIALRDLEDLQAEIVEEHGRREAMSIGRARHRPHAEAYDAIEDAKIGIEDTPEAVVLADVMRSGYYDEPPRIGTMEATRLFHAHAALQRLAYLLEDRRESIQQGKP